MECFKSCSWLVLYHIFYMWPIKHSLHCFSTELWKGRPLLFLKLNGFMSGLCGSVGLCISQTPKIMAKASEFSFSLSSVFSLWWQGLLGRHMPTAGQISLPYWPLRLLQEWSGFSGIIWRRKWYPHSCPGYLYKPISQPEETQFINSSWAIRKNFKPRL